jgi:hypothetical protein
MKRSLLAAIFIALSWAGFAGSSTPEYSIQAIRHASAEDDAAGLVMDLSGIWRDGDFPVSIEHKQNDNQLTGKWLKVGYQCDPGTGVVSEPVWDDFTDASLAGTTLKGKTVACSSHGIVKADMELQLSADGMNMDGWWFDTDAKKRKDMHVVRCEKYLLSLAKSALEALDSTRWTDGLHKTNSDMVSWKWPASFYIPDYNAVADDSWVSKAGLQRVSPAIEQPVPNPNLQLGDVVIFRGPSPTRPAISHSAIVTGRGEEVSQLWWTRAVRQAMHSGGNIVDPPAESPGPQSGGYGITRDTIVDLINEFTDGSGKKLFFNKYEVWRPKDPKPAALDELGRILCLKCADKHIVKSPASSTFLRP